jgi:type IV pilus biogenesis protein CpaD/CtpE
MAKFAKRPKYGNYWLAMAHFADRSEYANLGLAKAKNVNLTQNSNPWGNQN